jgi:hypothetical protein
MLTCFGVLYHFDRVFTGCDVWPSWTLPATVHKQKFGVTEARYTHFLGENCLQGKILSESDLNMMFTGLRDPPRNTPSVQFKVICDPWLNTRSKWYSSLRFVATQPTYTILQPKVISGVALWKQVEGRWLSASAKMSRSYLRSRLAVVTVYGAVKDLHQPKYQSWGINIVETGGNMVDCKCNICTKYVYRAIVSVHGDAAAVNTGLRPLFFVALDRNS